MKNKQRTLFYKNYILTPEKVNAKMKKEEQQKVVLLTIGLEEEKMKKIFVLLTAIVVYARRALFRGVTLPMPGTRINSPTSLPVTTDIAS